MANKTLKTLLPHSYAYRFLSCISSDRNRGKTSEQISELINVPVKRVEENLPSVVKEGFLKKQKGKRYVVTEYGYQTLLQCTFRKRRPEDLAELEEDSII